MALQTRCALLRCSYVFETRGASTHKTKDRGVKQKLNKTTLKTILFTFCVRTSRNLHVHFSFFPSLRRSVLCK